MTGEDRIGCLRLFVAIAVPDAVRESVLRVQRELQALAPGPMIRWTKPEQFHLTLRFLGDVPLDHIAALQKSLHAACAGVKPLPLRAQGVGFFPNGRRPRVIWVGIHDREERLSHFQERIEVAVRPHTVEPGETRFAGHITLGRIQENKYLDFKVLNEHAKLLADRLLGEWTVREIELIRSELRSDGARYTTLTACPLGTTIEPD